METQHVHIEAARGWVIRDKGTTITGGEKVLVNSPAQSKVWVILEGIK